MAVTDRLGNMLNPSAGVAIKAPVRVATTGANIVLAGLLVIDGVTLLANDRVLVKDQTDKTTNGLYNASTGVWTRTVDANSNTSFVPGTQVRVFSGASNGNAIFVNTCADNPATLGTSLLTFGTQALAATILNPVLQGTITLQTAAGGAVGNLAIGLSQSVLQWQGQGSGNTASIHINPGPGALPTGTITEYVCEGTNLQAFGGNYRRWSFSTLGSSLANRTGLIGETGGTGPIADFIIQTADENPVGVFTVQNFLYLRATATSSEASQQGAVELGNGDTVPQNKLVLNMANIGAPGTRDSHAFLLEGKANNGSERAVWWREKVSVTAQAGTSSLLWQQNLNAGGWTTRMTLPDTAVVTFPAATGIVALYPALVNSALLSTDGSGNITFNPTPSLSSSQNATSQIALTNGNAGVNALAGFSAVNNGGSGALFGMAGSNYTAVAVLQNRAFISSSVGIALQTTGANPIVFAPNSIEQARVLLGLMVGTTTDPGAGGIAANAVVQSPLVKGGTAANSTLTIESTSGAGTTDAIIFQTGSQAEVLRMLTGGNLKLTNAANFAANNARTVTISNVGPATIGATIAKWLTFQDSAGTLSYVPVWQ